MLKSGGLPILEESLEGLKTARSGVVVIDDAHYLEASREGQGVLDFVLKNSEKLSSAELGKVAWVMTGTTICLQYLR